MRISLIFLLLLFIFFNCKKEDRKSDLYSTELVEVLGPKEKGLYDSLNVPANLRDEVKKISSFNYFDTGVLGHQNPNIEYATPFSEFEKLKKKATIKEIYQLTFNKNPVVTLYSYIEVADRIPKLTPLFYSRLLNLKKEIYSQNGCIIGDLPPSQIFYDEYLKNVNEDKQAKDLILRKLDSISIYGNNTTNYVLNQALRHRVYPEYFHNRLEELAFAKQNPYVLLYLTKHFREQYKDRLQKSIISYLEKTNDDSYEDFSKNTLILELMKFKNPDNKKLLEKLLENNFILKDDHEVNLLKKGNGITK
ncbi:hypothetical protein NG800_016385 [Epilithonimonas ginsengisoli]|uniref:Uncharacterized protein n=1 Tax=Epilithonimonas ginsengisoli TaxID=1245592 RepID=A0ABU4JLF3_9FLAO|nr:MULTISPECIES: hypothetical protein [Chryseobacterium group]MBV6881546.1 hypothetical protein [Epilithonimonas sp. FP105]MDW8550507.1 hypothetical protein [Epilithonimonas ginsengisoli]OAH72793.1 hypothetical protein AXA65_09580 [Chryseobacterium sp. FP211-J200]